MPFQLVQFHVWGPRGWKQHLWCGMDFWHLCNGCAEDLLLIRVCRSRIILQSSMFQQPWVTVQHHHQWCFVLSHLQDHFRLVTTTASVVISTNGLLVSANTGSHIAWECYGWVPDIHFKDPSSADEIAKTAFSGLRIITIGSDSDGQLSFSWMNYGSAAWLQMGEDTCGEEESGTPRAAAWSLIGIGGEGTTSWCELGPQHQMWMEISWLNITSTIYSIHLSYPSLWLMKICGVSSIMMSGVTQRIADGRALCLAGWLFLLILTPLNTFGISLWVVSSPDAPGGMEQDYNWSTLCDWCVHCNDAAGAHTLYWDSILLTLNMLNSSLWLFL